MKLIVNIEKEFENLFLKPFKAWYVYRLFFKHMS